MFHCSHLCSLVFITRLLVTMIKLPVLRSVLENRVVDCVWGCDGTRRRKGWEVRGKQENGVGNQ